MGMTFDSSGQGILVWTVPNIQRNGRGTSVQMFANAARTTHVTNSVEILYNAKKTYQQYDVMEYMYITVSYHG